MKRPPRRKTAQFSVGYVPPHKEEVEQPTTTVADRLAKLGNLYAQRGAVYGKDYLHLGQSLVAMFPDGLTLTTAEEFNRFALFIHVHGKVMRYAQNMLRGGHADSLDDISVYAQLMRECDDGKE